MRESGGHFIISAHELICKKNLQAGFVWPSLHMDVQHHCKSCTVCQKAGIRRLTYEPQTPIISYGPFEKWELPTSREGKEYIVMG